MKHVVQKAVQKVIAEIVTNGKDHNFAARTICTLRVQFQNPQPNSIPT